MDNIIEKPEAYAVSMEPTFASYLQKEFLSNSSGKKVVPQPILLQRYILSFSTFYLSLVTYISSSCCIVCGIVPLLIGMVQTVNTKSFH